MVLKRHNDASPMNLKRHPATAHSILSRSETREVACLIGKPQVELFVELIVLDVILENPSCLLERRRLGTRLWLHKLSHAASRQCRQRRHHLKNRLWLWYIIWRL